MSVLVLVVYMLLHLLMCARACLCVCVHARTAAAAACLCVFACLSHDVLWRSLTNRTGASRRWGGVRVGDGHEQTQSREEELWSRGGGRSG